MWAPIEMSKEDLAYEDEIEAELNQRLPSRHRTTPFCTVRVGQACEFTVGPERKCWYCLLTQGQIAAGVNLGQVLRAMESQP